MRSICPTRARAVTAPVAAHRRTRRHLLPRNRPQPDGSLARYWAAHGGLAQFGYPQTEPFPEVNPADGKVYLAQYFERARLELHPEFAGTDAEVLLGLLGNELTAARRRSRGAPFQPVPTPASPA